MTKGEDCLLSDSLLWQEKLSEYEIHPPTSAPFVGFTQGYILTKRVMAVKDNGKCRGLTAFVKEALEHRSPCQDMLLNVQ